MSNVIGRRELLGGLAALSIVPACASSAPPPARPAPPPARPPVATAPPAAPSPARPAPSPLAALGPAPPPLGDEVFARRADRLRALTREARATVAFVSSGTTSFAYLAGARVERSERLIALVVPVDGDAFLVGPSFEAERLKRETRLKAVVPWEEQQSPYAVVRAALRAGKPRILVEPHTEYQAAQALARAGATLVDGTASFERLRVHKDDDELARLRHAIALTQANFDVAFAELRAGVRDREVSEAISARFKQAGHEGYALVQFAALSALPHGRPHGDPLAEDMAVLIDGGCDVDGYWSDITRTRWFGDRPPAEFTRVYQTVRDAQRAAIERVRPGVACQDIDRAARAVITQAGYGPYFTHRLGHGLGMDGHEPAYMVEGNTAPLEPGFVFTAEPGIYLPDRFGVRIEDDVLCGPDGAVLLSRPVAD
jgi:Xaa-Pro dipeptidase